MPIFYKGASPGTHWHTHDATSIGFTSRNPGMLPDTDRVMQHISRGNDSPYISLTRSYGVAYSYAVAGAISSDPGFIYEVVIDDPIPGTMQMLDPVKVVAASAPAPLASVPYQHDGLPEFLISVVDQELQLNYVCCHKAEALRDHLT